MQTLQFAAGVVEPALGAAAGLGRWWFVGGAVVPICGDFSRRQHSTTTAHRDLPLCELPALGIPWGKARLNAASAACSGCGGDCTGGCSSGQVGLWGLRFCRFVGLSRGGDSTRQPPQRTEPCQCVAGQPWACRAALQGQMQPLQSAAVVKRPAVGAAAGPSRWFVGVAFLMVCGDFQKGKQHSATTAHRAMPV